MPSSTTLYLKKTFHWLTGGVHGRVSSPWLDVFLHLFIANENKKDEGFDVELQ